MIKRKSAFTLVEMLVVIGIIGLLVALIVPGYMRYLDKARIKTTKLQLSTGPVRVSNIPRP